VPIANPGFPATHRGNRFIEEEEKTRNLNRVPSRHLPKSKELRRAGGPPLGRHLFKAWREVSARIGRARRLALLLDFDGTLVRLRRRPGSVRLPVRARRVLQSLASHPRVHVAVISGRRVKDVRRRVPVAGVDFWGLHGWERTGKHRAIPLKQRRLLLQAKRFARAHLREIDGVWVEDKGAAFSIHFRGARPEAVRRARRVVHSLCRLVAPDCYLLRGKKVWEFLPRDVQGKGAAAKMLTRNLTGRPLMIYAGDDLTDETAFSAIGRGITIRVGASHNTRASYFLRTPDEVLEFLERLEALL
jgi:trehalose-phosphatase